MLGFFVYELKLTAWFTLKLNQPYDGSGCPLLGIKGSDDHHADLEPT